MNKRIVYNRHDDGGVSICCPTEWAIDAMCNGGAWPSFPWYYPGFDEIQIERMIARGIRADVAVRYADFMMVGGATTAEALEVIRDRDCAPHGNCMELWDLDEIPADRWYRDAWKRSRNGGPIYVDLELARPIQFERLHGAVKAENEHRAKSLLDWRPAIELDWHALRRKILWVSSIEELRTVWPKELPCSNSRPASAAAEKVAGTANRGVAMSLDRALPATQ